jgi:hypothetical protein
VCVCVCVVVVVVGLFTCISRYPYLPPPDNIIWRARLVDSVRVGEEME